MIKTKKIMVPIHEKGVLGDMEMKISTQCLSCKHLTEPITCKAFPFGIPKIILEGKFDHTKPYKGDHNIQFERRL